MPAEIAISRGRLGAARQRRARPEGGCGRPGGRWRARARSGGIHEVAWRGVRVAVAPLAHAVNVHRGRDRDLARRCALGTACVVETGLTLGPTAAAATAVPAGRGLTSRPLQPVPPVSRLLSTAGLAQGTTPSPASARSRPATPCAPPARCCGPPPWARRRRSMRCSTCRAARVPAFSRRAPALTPALPPPVPPPSQGVDVGRDAEAHRLERQRVRGQGEVPRARVQGNPACLLGPASFPALPLTPVRAVYSSLHPCLPPRATRGPSPSAGAAMSSGSSSSSSSGAAWSPSASTPPPSATQPRTAARPWAGRAKGDPLTS